MAYKKIIAYINVENEAVSNVLKIVEKYSSEGADELFLYNYAKDTVSKAEFLKLLEKINDIVNIPFWVGYYAEQSEDIKKLFDAGASRVVINERFFKEKNLEEVCKSFDCEKLMIEIDSKGEFTEYERSLYWKQIGFGTILLKHVDASVRLEENIKKSQLPVIIRDSLTRHMIGDIINLDNVLGVATNYYRDKDLKKAKLGLKENGMLKLL